MPATFKVYASEGGVWSQVKVFDSPNDEQEARAFAVDLTRDGKFERSIVVERGSDGTANGVAYHLKYKAKKGANEPEATRPSAERRDAPAPLVLPVQKGLTGEWVFVGPRIAKRHKLYGVYGWLVYFAFSLGIGPFIEAMDILRGYDDTSAKSIGELVFTFVFICALCWVPLYLLHKRKQSFPSVVVSIFLVVLIACVAIPDFLAAGQSALLIGYVLLSKRVNVTYKHRVRRVDLQWIISSKQLAAAHIVPASASAEQEA